MRELYASGRIVDILLAFLALEVVAWVLWRRRQGLPIRVTAPIRALLPGILLLLALREALTGANWVWVALWLTVSLPAHLADFWRRAP
jgi:uncharacterized membrane protein YjjP (DUF1212 family)